eukprot:4714006-Pleurochrysis_carterae.AAC.1
MGPLAEAAAVQPAGAIHRRWPRVPLDETAEMRAARLAAKALAERRRRKRVKEQEGSERDARMAQSALH